MAFFMRMWVRLGEYAKSLEDSKRDLAAARAAEAEKQAEKQKADLDEWAAEHDDDYVPAMNEYFDEHNDDYEYGLITGPAPGSFLGLLQPVFDLFQSTPRTTADSAPVGHAMPESPNEEPLAAVSIRTLLDPPDKNSSKF